MTANTNLKENRLRLNENERVYLLRLIKKDVEFKQGMVGKPIVKLIEKLTKAKLSEMEELSGGTS